MMAGLAKRSARDSKLLKALTTLATMYLPATLFAVRQTYVAEDVN
jgi:hypothetical protein